MSWWRRTLSDDDQNARIEDARSALRTSDFRKAQKLLAPLIEGDALSMVVASLNYRAWKFEPDAKGFHDAAADRLALLLKNDVPTNRVHAVYADYAAVTQGRVQLALDLQLELAEKFAHEATINDAADIVRRILHTAESEPRLPAAMLAVARTFARIDPPHSRRLLYDIIGLFPESVEARAAKKFLENDPDRVN